jgi:hypothetical protein
MIARVATFVGGDNERLRRMIQESPPDPPEGVERVLVLANDEHRLLVTFFETAEAAAAAEARFEAMGDEVSEDIRGRRTSVEVFDVLLDGDSM